MKALLISSLVTVLVASCGTREHSEQNESESRIQGEPVLSAQVQAETKHKIDFTRHVKPILEKRCVWCHDGSDEGIRYGLTNREDAFEGKRIVPGKPQESLFYLAAGGKHPQLKMPAVGMIIAPSDLKVLERWITSGADWPEGETGKLKGL